MELVFSTNNFNKLKEVQKLLPPYIELLSLKDINCNDDIPETANSLKGNASLKSKYIFEKYNINCFSDDTGLEIDSLNGAPGVYSSRYAGQESNSHKNIQKVLQKMNGKKNRNAKFKTVISLILNGKEYFFEGKVNGKITTEICGDEGFGYDPIFIPEQNQRSFAQMTMKEKGKISHRGRAIHKLINFLSSLSFD